MPSHHHCSDSAGMHTCFVSEEVSVDSHGSFDWSVRHDLSLHCFYCWKPLHGSGCTKMLVRLVVTRVSSLTFLFTPRCLFFFLGTRSDLACT